MNIIVHRGTKQIGGMVTEICTDSTRIFIDMGSELPDENGVAREETLTVEGVTQGEKNCDAVFFTHYHGDHIGMLAAILPGVPLYMGEAAKEIYLVLQKRLKSASVAAIEAIKTLQALDKIIIGDITVTPFMVDHSAYDAYMFLIEVDGKKILHTGDFRTHGFRGSKTVPMLEKYVGQVDVLITEGTMLARDDSGLKTEYALQKEIKAYLAQYKYVFVFCSSTNIDRLASINQATPRGKYFLCDAYQKDVLAVAKKFGGQHTSLYAFEKVTTIGKNIADKTERLGFCMMVRANEEFKRIVKEYKQAHNEECLVIYSMWDGYLKQPGSQMKEMMDGFRHTVHLHTSGHATKQAIMDVCAAVAPKEAVIPVHSEDSGLIGSLGLPFPVKYLNDGEVYTLDTPSVTSCHLPQEEGI